jgi:hypothetical protein
MSCSKDKKVVNPSLVPTSETLITYVPSQGIGNIAVKIVQPDSMRYGENTGVIINISTFYTPINTFTEDPDFSQIGLITISYLWPGNVDIHSDAQSEGTWDYGGEISIQALKDVILFAEGIISNSDGYFLNDLITTVPSENNIGLYAFSHPGIAAVNVLSIYQNELSFVDYFVGRENPTLDIFSSVEIGHFEGIKPVYNPVYKYPASYLSDSLIIDYSKVKWTDQIEGGVPYWDLDESNNVTDGDYVLGEKIPRMFDKQCYSKQMTHALENNGALTVNQNWPDDLATPQNVDDWWPFRETPHRYQNFSGSGLKVMLVFAKNDHVHPAPDKPHIHQAFDGFKAANLWIRLNPDDVYMSFVHPGSIYTEHNANSEPVDWLQIEDFSYDNRFWSSRLVALAAVSEMADRTQENNWADNLNSVLFNYIIK